MIMYSSRDQLAARQAASARILAVPLTIKAAPREGSTGKMGGKGDTMVISGSGER